MNLKTDKNNDGKANMHENRVAYRVKYICTRQKDKESKSPGEKGNKEGSRRWRRQREVSALPYGLLERN